MRVLIDFADPSGAGPGALRCAFERPLRVLVAHSLAQVRPLLAEVSAEAQAGRWCVGGLAYEAAAAFEPAMCVHPADGPLAWFGVFEAPAPWPEAELAAGPAALAEWAPGPERAGFDAAVAEVQRAIGAGECYQINLTSPLQGQLRAGSPLALYAALRRAQPGGYSAFVDAGDWQWLSVSPELFFDWDGQRLLARPMKGTAARGADPEADRAQAEALRASPKERAENVMVVDLLRNDMSRLAEPFSVQVPRLFALQALPSVWQMTSDVVAQTRPGTQLEDIFAALFPCGSVTGAPKLQAMRGIHALEPQARGIYCGALGVVRPGGAATFNVPIRTVSARQGQLRCGIGSGITAGASAEGEWREWRQKRAFLTRAEAPFELLETLALVNGRFRHRAEHLARLGRAAAHFGYPLGPAHAAALDAALDALAAQHPTGAWRVRLLLDAQGQPSLQAFALEPSPSEVLLALAEVPFEAADSEFVRFKTTRRAHYEAAALSQPGVFDTVLWNERGELTECCRGNIALRLDGAWWTPPLASGLLDGVGRALALREGRLRERVLRREDLARASGLAFVNSLRGWLAARLLGPGGE